MKNKGGDALKKEGENKGKVRSASRAKTKGKQVNNGGCITPNLGLFLCEYYMYIPLKHLGIRYYNSGFSYNIPYL